MSCKWVCGVPPARPPPASIVKAAVIKLHASIVSINGIESAETLNANASPCPPAKRRPGLGVLIHPTLVLTTHSTIPSRASIKNATISVCHDLASSSYAKLKLLPEIFFQTDEELNVTVVSCETFKSDSETLALDTAKLSRRALRKDHTTFLMGCQDKGPEDVVMLEGNIAGVHKTGRRPKLILFQTGDVLWVPGSAGFDEFGTFSFMVTSSPSMLHKKVKSDKKSSVLEGFFAGKYPKQQAISIQVVKDWIEPFWRMHRERVFQGPQVALCDAAPAPAPAFKRPSLLEDPLQRPKSVMQRGSLSSKTSPENLPIRQLQETEVAEAHPALSEAAPPSLPQKPPELPERKPTVSTRSVAVETMQEEPEPALEKRFPKVAKEKQKKTRNQSPNAAASREQKPKEFTSPMKKTNLKKISKSTATEEPDKDDVSVQTELFVTEADVKPMVIVSRTGTPEPGAIPPGEVAGTRKGQRERWSLPADGHGLDFLREMDESPAPPVVIRQRSVSMPAHRASYEPLSDSPKEAENVPAWMDKYYARGRSLSELPSRASSAGTTPLRPRRQGGLDADLESEGDDSTSNSGSSSRSLQRGQSAYFRPTISYMQKRNPGQRDSILARQASQTTLPRWS